MCLKMVACSLEATNQNHDDTQNNLWQCTIDTQTFQHYEEMIMHPLQTNYLQNG